MSGPPRVSHDREPTRSRPNIPWLADFTEKLVADPSRSFVDWAATKAAPHVVLRREDFGPEDLRQWLGHVSILQWDPSTSDYCYRLFGSNLPEILGIDFSGKALSAWPEKLALAKRIRLDTILSRSVPAAVHSVVLHDLGHRPWQGASVVEQVMWPMRYGSATCDAVLDFTVLLPAESGLDAASLHASTGRQSRWFLADGSLPPFGNHRPWTNAPS